MCALKCIVLMLNALVYLLNVDFFPTLCGDTTSAVRAGMSFVGTVAVVNEIDWLARTR